MKLTVETVTKLLRRWADRVYTARAHNDFLVQALRDPETARDLEPLINELLDDPTDDTWTRIVFRAPHDVPIPGREWIYYHYPEHGGPVDDPLHAAHFTSLDEGFLYNEDEARKHWPDRDWQRARLIIDVRPFHHPEALDLVIDYRLRETALKKLTAHEKRALGLSDG